MRLFPALRPVLAALLALAVALTSVHTAIGRAEARGASDILICAEGGVATITLGADGKPVIHLHGCPDCVLGGLAVTAGATPVATFARRRATRLSRPHGRRSPATARPAPWQARGPPARV